MPLPSSTQGISFADRGNAGGLSACCLQATLEVLLLILGSLGRVTVLIVGVGAPFTLRFPAQAHQAIILAPGSAWVTKCQQEPGHTARNGSDGTLFGVCFPLFEFLSPVGPLMVSFSRSGTYHPMQLPSSHIWDMGPLVSLGSLPEQA